MAGVVVDVEDHDYFGDQRVEAAGGCDRESNLLLAVLSVSVAIVPSWPEKKSLLSCGGSPFQRVYGRAPAAQCKVLELAQISTLIRDRVDTVADRWANFRVPKSDQNLESLKTDSKSRYPKLDGPPVCMHWLPHRISRKQTDMVADSKLVPS